MSAQDDVRSKFRITTDGQRYRVEHRVKRLVWSCWWCRSVEAWEPLGRYVYPLGWQPSFFTNLQEAEDSMTHQIALEAAKRHGWLPVEDAP